MVSKHYTKGVFNNTPHATLNYLDPVFNFMVTRWHFIHHNTKLESDGWGEWRARDGVSGERGVGVESEGWGERRARDGVVESEGGGGEQGWGWRARGGGSGERGMGEWRARDGGVESF